MLTEAGKIALTKEIISSKKLLKELKRLENEWDVLHKHNKISATFWKIDKRIMSIYKRLSRRAFSPENLADFSFQCVNYPTKVKDVLKWQQFS